MSLLKTQLKRLRAAAGAVLVTAASALGAAQFDDVLEHTQSAKRVHAMPDMVLALLSTINQISKYPLPASFPRVHQVPHDELARQACGGSCNFVKAAYVPEVGLLMDRNLDPEASVMDRSILLHELVHHLQAMTGRYADLPECERRQREELEAFSIQNAYLASVRSGQQVAIPRYVHAC